VSRWVNSFGQGVQLPRLIMTTSSNLCPLVCVNLLLCVWRESEPVDINSQWRESWKSASVVNAHLVDDPTIRQPGFALARQQWSLTAVPVRRNGNFQTPISVPAVRPKLCHTLSNPAHRQDYTVACLNYTLQMMMPSPGWPDMAPKCIRQQQQLCVRVCDMVAVMYCHPVAGLVASKTFHQCLPSVIYTVFIQPINLQHGPFREICNPTSLFSLWSSTNIVLYKVPLQTTVHSCY